MGFAFAHCGAQQTQTRDKPGEFAYRAAEELSYIFGCHKLCGRDKIFVGSMCHFRPDIVLMERL